MMAYAIPNRAAHRRTAVIIPMMTDIMVINSVPGGRFMVLVY